MVSYQQKINIMRKEFAEIDLNHDELLTQQELYSYLDKKVSMKKFNFYLRIYIKFKHLSLYKN